MRLPLDTADDDHRLAEVGLGMSRRMRQPHEHLATPPFPLARVGLDDCITAGEPVLIPKPFENPLGRMALLAIPALILHQPSVDDLGEAIQLGPSGLGLAPVSRRQRKAQHLPDTVARNPKLPRRFSPTHAAPTRQTDLPIQIQGENTPALPVARKGKRGRLLRRPQQGHPADTVVDFRTGVHTTSIH